MLSEANFLILDEPTNHLDITSKEILEQALVNYTGTVLYVSHDRYFINQTATRILELTGQTLINYIGNYDYYLEKKELLNSLYVPDNTVSGTAPLKGKAQGGAALAEGSRNKGIASPLFRTPGTDTKSLPAGAAPSPEGSAGTTPSAPSGASGVKLDWMAQKEEQARIRKRQNDLKKVEDEIHRLETRDSEIDELLLREDIYTNVEKLVELNQEKDQIQKQLEPLYEKWEELAE